jgi:hypothetical protein
MDRRGPKYEPGVGGGGWGVDTRLAGPVILTDMSWNHCKIHFPNCWYVGSSMDDSLPSEYWCGHSYTDASGICIPVWWLSCTIIPTQLLHPPLFFGNRKPCSSRSVSCRN